MTRTSSTTTAGVTFSEALLLLFIALKLTGYIDWSWWWVLSPLWISLALVALILGGIGVALLIIRTRR